MNCKTTFQVARPWVSWQPQMAAVAKSVTVLGLKFTVLVSQFKTPSPLLYLEGMLLSSSNFNNLAAINIRLFNNSPMTVKRN